MVFTACISAFIIQWQYSEVKPFHSDFRYFKDGKVPKFLDTRKLCCNHPKTGKKRFYHRVMHPKDADSIANSEDPDQPAPLGTV